MWGNFPIYINKLKEDMVNYQKMCKILLNYQINGYLQWENG